MFGTLARRLARTLLAALSVAALAWPGAHAGDIRLHLEEPFNGGTFSGVANVRGYAFSTVPLRSVQLYINGALESNLPVGGRRNDVGDAFPNNPFARDSGFSIAFGYLNLNAGMNTFVVRTEDVDGAVREVAATFRVVSFPGGFVSSPGQVSLDGAFARVSGDALFLDNFAVRGARYSARLRWQTGPQAFMLTDIVPAGSQGAGLSPAEAACLQSARLLGRWRFAYTIVTSFHDNLSFIGIVETGDPDTPCAVFGYDSFGNLDVVGGYSRSAGLWAVLDLVQGIPGFAAQAFGFDFITNDRVQGEYAQLDEAGRIRGGTYSMSGTRLSPSSTESPAAVEPKGHDAQARALELEQASAAFDEHLAITHLRAMSPRRDPGPADKAATSLIPADTIRLLDELVRSGAIPAQR